MDLTLEHRVNNLCRDLLNNTTNQIGIVLGLLLYRGFLSLFDMNLYEDDIFAVEGYSVLSVCEYVHTYSKTIVCQSLEHFEPDVQKLVFRFIK